HRSSTDPSRGRRSASGRRSERDRGTVRRDGAARIAGGPGRVVRVILGQLPRRRFVHDAPRWAYSVRGGTVSDGAGRRLSPAVRAFIAVDVVLVLVFVVVLLVNRSDAGDEPVTAATTTSETTAASPSTGSSGETTTPSGEESAGEETGDPESESARLFASPSGNIMCSITEDGASCSIAELAEEDRKSVV